MRTTKSPSPEEMLHSFAAMLGSALCASTRAADGGEQDYDACGSSGTVEGLNPHGDGFLAVKAGPGVNFERIDKLYNGMQVYICGEQGDWFAIVYSQTGSWSERCNVSTPWPRAMPYTGPCRSGWVHRRWVGSLAG
jgi:hypothetical protein